ncbi:hypothetical protein [Neofamilia massiliensis]|uniref:hypothetical protein n=1 Tax=Neofamilia massiliensis TaxID=1673724 RepID=UPI0006BB79FB|nr:hypothetical protein [Neofamilia massiliensis]
MNKTLIYYKNKKNWKEIQNLLRNNSVECVTLCYGLYENNILTLLQPLYFKNGESEYNVSVDKIALMKFLKLVHNKTNCYPCVIHNHLKYNILKFSLPDSRFEESLNDYLNEYNKEVIMILYGVNNDILIHSKSLGLKMGIEYENEI